MRNVAGGILLALLLAAALFAVGRHAWRPARQTPETHAAAAQAAAQIPAGFQGQRKIGDWQLSCGTQQKPPRTPGAHKRTQRDGTEASVWKIPRCRAFAAVADPDNPGDDIRATFRRVGMTRALSLFLRIPRRDVAPNDVVSLRLDKTSRRMTVRRCRPEFCIAKEELTKADMRLFIGVKSLSVSFVSRSSGKHAGITIPTDGLPQAIETVLRIDR
jgi:invasion protein IalB